MAAIMAGTMVAITAVDAVIAAVMVMVTVVGKSANPDY
jgi:hypothetical protein